MSGGSYNYIYSQLRDECVGRMHDAEMDEMIEDLCKVLHDLEWCTSGDICEQEFRETLAEFKAKWFKGDRTTRLKGYIDKQIGVVRRELYAMLGEILDGEEE